MHIVDSHCHLDRLKLEKLEQADLDFVVSQAFSADVKHMLCIGIDKDNAPIVKAIAEKYPQVFASVGVHPLDAKDVISKDELLALADAPKVVAIGETGLDYYYSEDSKDVQQESFVTHLQVAKQRQLPVVVHTRNAREDTLRLIKEHGCTNAAGVLHCFTESWEMAKAAMELGYYISFSGIVTFKNAQDLQDVAKKVPLDRMLVETDSPYLTPVPFRGKPNYPKHTRDVAEFISQLRGQSLEQIAEATTENFFTLFNQAKPVVWPSTED